MAIKKASKKAVTKKPIKKVSKKTNKATAKSSVVTKMPKRSDVEKQIVMSEEASAKAKEKSTKDGLPYIQVLGIDVNPEDPTMGAFRLDWNSLFVKQLRSLGYLGDDEEKIIDQWFKTVCRHVYIDSFEQEQAAIPGNGRRRTKSTPLENGRSEIS